MTKKENVQKQIEKDEIERNLYLKSLLTGERQGPLTNIPSVDKPWLSKYTNEQINSIIPNRKMYEDILEYTRIFPDYIAIEYFGNQILYGELKEKIEEVASALVNSGIKKNDKVTISMPYLPETVYLVYALNKIGAVVNMVDPRIQSEIITEFINKADSEYAFIINKAEEKFAKLKPNTNLKEIISVSPTESMENSILRNVGKLKKSKFIKWDKFISRANQKVKTEPFVPNELAVLEYTSGTSGEPKGVMLPNESFNTLAHFQQQSLLNEKGDKFLLIMPPFIAYGLVIGMHGMLCQGQHLIMIPNFTLDKAPKMLPKLVKKHKPEWIMGVPNFLRILMDYKKDLSHLKGMIVGGDHLDTEVEKQAREFFKQWGNSTKLLKGWGMTELAACGSFTKTDVPNEIGSVGVPLSRNIVKVLQKKEDGTYDIDGPELTYGEEGTLFFASPSLSNGYHKNEDATNKVFYYDKSGRKWLNTEDVFKIDKGGNLFFTNREKRIIVRPDGHNIPTTQIEAIASIHPKVYNTAVVGIPSKKYKHGSIAAVCIETKEKNLDNSELKSILEEIERMCNIKLQPRDRAKYYVIVDEIKYTQNGKVSYEEMTKIVSEKTEDIICDENSLKSEYILPEKSNVKTRKRKF